MEAGFPPSDHHAAWSEQQGALYVPVSNQREVVGYARRTFDPKSYRPVTEDISKFFAWVRKPSATCVLTEDVLSCYRIARATPFDSIALMGTELKDGVKLALAQSDYQNVIVFLDGDNPIVRMKARKIAKSLPFLRTTVVEDGRDPKRHTDEELCSILKC